MATELNHKTRHIPFVSKRGLVSLIKLVVIISIITIAGSGCVFSRYKLVKEKTPPPNEMNLTLNQPPIEVLLNSVIIYKGPGSWKREAYWDEYIVSIANQGGLPLSIASATLVDFQDNHNSSGSDPWELEKQSKAWWKGIRASGAATAVALGGGTVASAWLFSSSFGLWGAGSSTGMALGAAGAVILPVVGVSYIIGNTRGRSKIEKEFDQRRLVLPATIPNGKAVHGCLFFPISPGPKCLILHYQVGEEEQDVKFDLSPLKALHMKDEDAKLPDSSLQEPAR